MSTINSKNVQVGTSNVAAENFTLYQPAIPDGTVRLGVGNSGATTGDVVTVNSAGVTVTGVATATTFSGSGASLTALNGTNISSGTVAVARLAASGTPSASTYLRGDSSWATVSGGVTSITAGNGLTGGTITTSGTIALDYYTGTDSNNTSFPLGSYIIGAMTTNSAIATAFVPKTQSGNNRFNTTNFNTVAGAWRSRGLISAEAGCPTLFFYLLQRVA